MKNKFSDFTKYLGLAILFQLSFLSFGQIVHTENFDATNTNALPTGWSAVGTAANFSVSTFMGNGINATPYSGLNILRMKSGTASPATEAVSTPSFSLQGLASNVATVSFWIFRDSLLPTNYDSLNVMINTQQSLTGAQSLGLIARSRTINIPDTKSSNGWYQYSFNIPASYTSATNYIIFKSTIYGTGNNSRRICIDDVAWTEYPPACTGTPTAGTISSPNTLICGGGGIVQLTLNGATTGTGISYDWSHSNSASGPWTAFGTNSLTVTSDSIYATTYFKCTVTCAGSGSSATNILTAVVSPNAPLVSITSTADTICFGDSVTLTGSGASSYIWQNNNGQQLSTNATYTVTPTQATTYTYNLIGTDAIGCQATASKTIRVGRIPTINSLTNPTTICSGSSSTLTVAATSGGGGGGFGVTLSYLWTPGNQTTSSITVSPTDSTMYHVTVFGQYGCSRMDSTYVTINPLLTGPSVTIDQPTIDFCQGAVTTPIVVVASSSVAGSTFSWKNANGNTVSTNDTLTINNLFQSTTYSVTVSDPSNGCSSSASSVISIHPFANAAFTNVVGTNYDVTFTNTSTNATTYSWEFGDGSTSSSQNPVHTYASTGSFTVTLIAMNATGCDDTLTQTILVTSPSDPPIGGSITSSSATICGGPGTVDLTLVNSSIGNGITFTWFASSNISGPYTSFGNSSTTVTSNTLTQSSYFYCKVTNNNGSTNSDTLLVTVNPNQVPVVSITSTADTICLGDSFTLTGSGASSYVWQNNNGQQLSTNATYTVTPTQATTYTYNLIGTDAIGCQATASKTIRVGRIPTIISITNPTTICSGSSSTLTVAATSGGGGGGFGVTLSYLWTPGNQTTSSITVSPTDSTMYHVTVFGQYGCSRMDSTYVKINPLLTGPSVTIDQPTIDFCQGAVTTPIVVVASSSVAGSTFSWINANGNNVSTNDTLTINNLFQSTTYSVTVSDPSTGCSSSASSVISIQANATALFTDVVGVNYDVTFTNTSMNATSYAWDFGDGSTSSSQNPVHTYASSGSYTVTLIAMNSTGCDDTLTQTILVTSPSDPPIGGSVTSSSATICGGSGTADLTLINSSIGNGITYIWYASLNISGPYTSFGNSSTTVTSNTLTQSTYFYCKVTNNNGSTNSDTLLVTVNPNQVPVVSITSTADTICLGDSFTLTGTGASSYVWQNNNGQQLSTNATYTVTPTQATTYTYNLIGTDAIGCSSLPVTKTIVVGTNPTIANVSNSNSTICLGGSSTLSVTAFAGGGAQLTYNWSTGESTQSIDVSPSTTTLYTVTVSGMYGCSSSDTTSVTVDTSIVGPTITINQSTVELCQGATSQVTVVATSSVDGSTFAWMNGNTPISTNDTLIVSAPNQSTTYTINVTDPSNGCVSTASAAININPLPTANLTTSNQTICSNGSTVIDLTIGNTGGQSSSAYSINWTPGTLSGSTITVNPASTTTYYVSVTSPFGCSQSDSIAIIVDPALLGAIISISPSSTTQCQSNLSPVMLVVNSNDPLVTYTWMPQSVVSINDTILVNPLNTTTYTVSATNQVGCVSSASSTVTVEPDPIASFTFTNNSTNTAVFNTSTTGSTYVWLFGDGATSNVQNPTHIYASSGTFDVTLVVTSNSGCSDTIIQSVTVSNASVLKLDNNETPIEVFPNPTNGLFTLQFKPSEEKYYLTVVNLVGELLFENRINCPIEESHKESIDISDLPKGLYIVNLKSESVSHSIRILKN